MQTTIYKCDLVQVNRCNFDSIRGDYQHNGDSFDVWQSLIVDAGGIHCVVCSVLLQEAKPQYAGIWGIRIRSMMQWSELRIPEAQGLPATPM